MGEARKIDANGRITIGKQYADSQFIVNEKKDGSILLVPAVTIPAREAWLHKNRASLSKVKAGIQQSSACESAPDPQAKDDGKSWLKEIDESQE